MCNLIPIKIRPKIVALSIPIGPFNKCILINNNNEIVMAKGFEKLFNKTPKMNPRKMISSTIGGCMDQIISDKGDCKCDGNSTY